LGALCWVFFPLENSMSLNFMVKKNNKLCICAHYMGALVMFLYCFWTWWYIHIRFQYLQDFIIIKKVKVKYVKIQDKIINIFINPLKYEMYWKL
jgi:hypothetical protein